MIKQNLTPFTRTQSFCAKIISNIQKSLRKDSAGSLIQS